MDKQHLEEVLQFIRQHRSQEGNFDTLYQKLEDEIAASNDTTYREALGEIKEKEVQAYRQQKNTGGSAWPEFEKFASEFEKAIAACIKSQ